MDTIGLLSTAEAAKKLKRHPGTLVNWRVWKKGPKYVRNGREVWYRPDDVEVYAEGQKRAEDGNDR